MLFSMSGQHKSSGSEVLHERESTFGPTGHLCHTQSTAQVLSIENLFVSVFIAAKHLLACWCVCKVVVVSSPQDSSLVAASSLAQLWRDKVSGKKMLILGKFCWEWTSDNLFRPMNTITLKGNFSIGEIYSWLQKMIGKEVPDFRRNDNMLESSGDNSSLSSSSANNVMMFENVLVGSSLVCTIKRLIRFSEIHWIEQKLKFCAIFRCQAEFKSDNISTIAILKDFITKEATTKHIKLEISMSWVRVQVHVHDENLADIENFVHNFSFHLFPPHLSI